MSDDLSNHCISIKEYIADASGNPSFGIVIADCSTAEFSIAAFEDDACRTRLETTIRQHRPRDVLCERGNLSVPTRRLLQSAVGPLCTITMLQPGKEFPKAEKGIEAVQNLFESFDEDNRTVPAQITDHYDNEQAMSALGAMVKYLKTLNLDKDLLAVRNFNIFDPIRNGQSLVLDGQTLAHIEVLRNSLGTDEGTLFSLLCRCNTAFGKRLFLIWVCQPLREARLINDR